MPTRFAPLLSIFLGIILFLGFAGISFTSTTLGIIVGLSSCGLFSGVKAQVRQIALQRLISAKEWQIRAHK